MQRIGIFGGSFNPPHSGHKTIAYTAIKSLKLDKLYIMVTPQNPFKPKTNYLPQGIRINLCKQIIKHPAIKIVDFESDLKTPESYNTVKKALKVFKNSKLFWIMGADNLEHFDRWKNSTFIAKNTELVVFYRHGFHKFLRQKSAVKYNLFLLNMRHSPESSTEIRKKLGDNWQAVYFNQKLN